MPAANELKPFPGVRVLVLEDEFLVAGAIKSMLESLGCEVVAVASTVEEGCRIIKEQPIDLALLDIHLNPGTCEPVARSLRYRSVPFVFITGYSNLEMLPDDLRGHQILHKPVDAHAINRVLHEALQSR